jgi:hypothetical protein
MSLGRAQLRKRARGDAKGEAAEAAAREAAIRETRRPAREAAVAAARRPRDDRYYVRWVRISEEMVSGGRPVVSIVRVATEE